jgi:hypothetical protein
MPRAPRIAWLVIALLAQTFAMPSAIGSPWGDLKAEFDRICGQMQVAPSLNEAEIRLLIEDSRALREALLQSENPQAKVFLKRIKMCEDFFEYSLEVQSENASRGDSSG